MVVLLQENATTLLTAGGVVGTVATGILAGRGGIKAAHILEDEKMRRFVELAVENPTPAKDEIKAEIVLSTKDKIWVAGPQFIPSVIVGVATITSIITSHRMSSAKVAALAAAYGLAERNFGEYKEKVAEKLSGPKQAAIREELAQEQADRTPGAGKVVFVEGEVLCFDQPTSRYFNSTVENIRRAANATNAEVFNHGYASASYFYSELGLPSNVWSGEVGWTADLLCEVDIDTILSEGGRPCVAVNFKHMPKADFRPNY